MDTYLDNIDVAKLDSIMHNTSVNVNYFNDTCDRIVSSYTEGLDNLMKDIYVECVKADNPTMNVMQKYYLELTNMIYFMVEKLEKLGVYSDMSLSASKEVYSKSYLKQSMLKDANGKSKSTVAELQAQANMDAQYETVVSSIYERAYKIVKGKISSAQDMADSLKRILYTMTTEMSLSMSSSSYQNDFRGDR